jgi:hypothetical protein
MGEIMSTLQKAVPYVHVQDAEWMPASEVEHQATGVAIGSGLSCTTDLSDASVYALQGLGRKCATCP